MITREVIKNIYLKYPRRAKSADCLDFAMLFESVGELHNITVDPESCTLTIGSLEPRSILHNIPLTHIHAFVPFEEWTALVLHSTIVFLNRRKPTVSVHLKEESASLAQRLRNIVSRKK